MELLTVFLVLIIAVTVDFLWFDVEQKRWGWMKSWSKRNKVLFFAGFFFVAFFLYLGLGWEYL